jgi:hypothetical protein
MELYKASNCAWVAGGIRDELHHHAIPSRLRLFQVFHGTTAAQNDAVPLERTGVFSLSVEPHNLKVIVLLSQKATFGGL